MALDRVKSIHVSALSGCKGLNALANTDSHSIYMKKQGKGNPRARTRAVTTLACESDPAKSLLAGYYDHFERRKRQGTYD